MNPELWTAVDQYLCSQLSTNDAALDAAVRASAAAKLPEIQVAPNQGKLLQMLAKLAIATSTRRNGGRILEIGTLGGYSAIWMARALGHGGRLVSLEANAEYARVAAANVASAGLASRVRILTGRAIDTLPTLTVEAPFDMVFIDADKASTPDYFQWALKLTRPGSLIVVDNVVRDGEVIKADSTDPSVLGMRRFFDLAAAEPRITATALQTVGMKGYDGLALAIVNN